MTTTISQPQRLSLRKKLLFSLIICSCLTMFFLFFAEVLLRLKGFGPLVPNQSNIIVEPAGRYYIKHPTLGYALSPGAFTVTLPGPYSFRTTHLSNGLRITHPLNTYTVRKKKEIWIFGCSFTHGWSLNDEETYPWVLQENLASYEVVNFGVGGYSTLQSLIQFREALEDGRKPSVVIVSYGYFHDQRNAMTRAWIKTRVIGGYRIDFVNHPYGRLNSGNKVELLYGPMFEYREVPLMRSLALANFFDDMYNRLLERTYQSREVSKALIEDFSSICRTNGVELIVAGIYSDPATTEMLEYCNSRGIMTVDISVDLSLKENNNRPYDGHPSAIANQKFAQKLGSFLCTKLTDEPLCAK